LKRSGKLKYLAGRIVPGSQPVRIIEGPVSIRELTSAVPRMTRVYIGGTRCQEHGGRCPAVGCGPATSDELRTEGLRYHDPMFRSRGPMTVWELHDLAIFDMLTHVKNLATGRLSRVTGAYRLGNCVVIETDLDRTMQADAVTRRMMREALHRAAQEERASSDRTEPIRRITPSGEQRPLTIRDRWEHIRRQRLLTERARLREEKSQAGRRAKRKGKESG